MNDKSESHPSFGMIGISHTSSTGTYLVGSEFRHRHFVTLRICRATKHRDLSREWWHGGERLIEIALSEAQFVEFMARPNIGDGVTCTLDYVGGEHMPPPPVPVSEQAQHRADLEAKAKKAVEALDAVIAGLEKSLSSGKIGKKELGSILADLRYGVRQEIADNMPFVAKSFDEHMEKTVHHAAAEIEATVANIAIRLGIERMREISEGGPKLIEEGESADENRS